MATSFSILILFIGSLEGIIVSVFFLTAAVVAASREDLKELSSARWTYVVLIFLIAALIVGISFSLPQLYGNLFYSLALLNSVLLIVYLLMKRSARSEMRNGDSTSF
ncbi:MAG: hypothetical protein PXY39_00180 [archaeon]|nr:hypothetical protein [archaeon]